MSNLPASLIAFRDAIGAEYSDVRPLGAGGMATVLLAEERALKRLVAIKVLDAQLAQDPTYRTRFAREAEAAARLQHPNIVPIYRVGEAAGLPYFAMQYVEGETLATRITREGKLEPETASRITREVAQALGVAHRRGVVHRDVKPHNILLEAESGRALVTDFGIARLLSAETAAATVTQDQLTGVGRMIGTPRYMSPEQATGGLAVGPASDQYSLGVVLYEMLSGAFPYEETPGRNPMVAHVVDPVIPIASRVANLPEGLGAITERLLQKDPTSRFASTDELIAALSGASTIPRPIAVPTRSRRPLVAGAIVAIVAAAVLGMVMRNRDAGREDPRHSLLVGYFDNTSRDQALEWLRIGGVELMARSLSRWTDLRFVETSRLLDLARKAKIDEGATMSHDDVLQLARDAGAGTAGVGSILRTGPGRSSITLRLYDVRSDNLLTEATEEVAADSLMPNAFARLADRVFSIAGAPQSAVIDAEPPTRSLTAYRAYVSALRASNHWKLDSTEHFLSAAVVADPTFALAWIRRAKNDVFRNGPFEPTAPFLKWSDSALKYAAGRPAKERVLIEGMHHGLAARFGEARIAARRLISLDSLNAEGWWLLGFATALDRYLVKDAAGRDSTGYDPTIALRSLQKARVLDGSNHQTIAGASLILREITFERPGYPAGQTFLRRGRPTALSDVTGNDGQVYRAVLVSPDSFRFGPLAEVNRLTSATDSAQSRSMAMGSLRELADHWLSVGPDEAQAHLLRSDIAERDKKYDEAFEALERSFQLDSSWSLVPPDWERLRLALIARRDSQAQILGARLEKRFGDLAKLPDGGGGYFGLVGNTQMMTGRLAAALVTEAFANSARRSPRQITPMTTLVDSLRAFRSRAWSGQLAPQELAVVRQRTAAFIAGQPEALQERMRTNLMIPIGFAAANLGDTAAVAKLRAESMPSRRTIAPGLSALAAALTGNKAETERWLARAAADTSFPWPGSRFTAGQAAQLIGRSEDAMRFHQAVDDASLGVTGVLDFDWIIFARSIKARGDAALAMNDTASARRHYERFVRLWKDADRQFVPERDLALAALESLKRGDRPQVRVIPR